MCYAVIPLTYEVGRFLIEDGEHSVPTAYSLPKTYTSPVAEEEIKVRRQCSDVGGDPPHRVVQWFDKEKKKPNFFFETRVVSTIFSQDPHIQEFFNQYHNWQDSPRFVDVCRTVLLSSYTISRSPIVLPCASRGYSFRLFVSRSWFLSCFERLEENVRCERIVVLKARACNSVAVYQQLA